MAKDNAGYHALGARFDTSDLLSELSREQNRITKDLVCINIEDYRNPYPAMHFFIHFCLGAKKSNPQDTHWEDQLNSYMLKCLKQGVSIRRLNGITCRIMSKYKFGIEGFRIIRSVK